MKVLDLSSTSNTAVSATLTLCMASALAATAATSAETLKNARK